jgi:hypothetical protein
MAAAPADSISATNTYPTFFRVFWARDEKRYEPVAVRESKSHRLLVFLGAAFLGFLGAVFFGAAFFGFFGAVFGFFGAAFGFFGAFGAGLSCRGLEVAWRCVALAAANM